MKDDHQADHLEVAMQTPDGNFHKVIPSAFLWTVYERSYGRLTRVLFPSFKSCEECVLHQRATPFTELKPCWPRSITGWETILWCISR